MDASLDAPRHVVRQEAIRGGPRQRQASSLDECERDDPLGWEAPTKDAVDRPCDWNNAWPVWKQKSSH
jgi:hypothetical protein